MQNLSVGSDAAVKLRAGERMNFPGKVTDPLSSIPTVIRAGTAGAWPEQRTAEKISHKPKSSILLEEEPIDCYQGSSMWKHTHAICLKTSFGYNRLRDDRSNGSIVARMLVTSAGTRVPIDT